MFPDEIRFFNENEVCNPYFDGNPAQYWDNMPIAVQNKMYKTLIVLDYLRSLLSYKMRITSTWRPKGSSKSAHFTGKAIDAQLVNHERDRGAYHELMKQAENVIPVFPDWNIRFIIEYQGRGMWLHIDVDHGIAGQYIMYPDPVSHRWQFENYDGNYLPIDKY